MGIEIERKFLIDHKKWQLLSKPDGTHYRQGYLASDDKTTIRVRIAGEHGYITIKGITTGFSRREYEYEIPVDEAAELLDNFALSEIEKIRYRIIFEDKLWEVDEFLGDNSGLIIAEIELESEDEVFQNPDWITGEVTYDDRYYNSNLSRYPFKSWKP
jgi:CYTH domain-containing protein